MKTVIYIRVSSEQQSKHGFSMENQKDRAEAYCAYKGFSNIEIITDEAKSGKRFDNRSGIQQIIEMADNKQIDNLIVYSISRIGRNAIETLAFIEHLKKKKVTLHSITESADGSTPYGRYIIGIIALNAQLESELIGERTHAILSNKKSKNETYSTAPYGLKIEGRVISDDGKVLEAGKLIPHEDEAPIVKFIFSRNTYPAEIKDFLNNAGVKTKKAKQWSNQSVKNILNNKALYANANII